MAVNPVSGGSYTYSIVDAGNYTLRSNGGALMVDMLPGTGGILPLCDALIIINNDPTAFLVLGIASGASWNSPTPFRYLGPSQTIKIVSDGAKYYIEDAASSANAAAPLVFYVDPTGDDTAKHGMSPDAPFQKMQYAWGVGQWNFNCRGNSCTISLSGATHTSGLYAELPIPGAVGTIVKGAGAGNTLVSTVQNCFTSGQLGCFTVENLKMQSSSSYAIVGGHWGYPNVGPGCDFGPCAAGHMLAGQFSDIAINAGYTISGNAPVHMYATDGGEIGNGGNPIVTTINPSLTFSTAFAYADSHGRIQAAGMNFAGSRFTGQAYVCNNLAEINTGGAGTDFFKGTIAGTSCGGPSVGGGLYR